MTHLVTPKDLATLLQKIGVREFFRQLITQLAKDFSRWQEFDKSPRYAMHLPHGVMELMPTGDEGYFAYKFVNGHPGNPKHGKLTVAALGMLAENKHGYPLLLSEMTLLTALRTAATAALAAKYMARKNSCKLALIGCGAQAEFMVQAHCAVLDIEQVSLYDLDRSAAERVQRNLADTGLVFDLAESTEQVLKNADIVITATAAKQHVQLMTCKHLSPGMHINAMGGDCPGKTELDPMILEQARVIVEYLPQTMIEGEIQLLGEAAIERVAGELWQVVRGEVVGRANDVEVTVFDGVGFAIEDYSVLRLVYQLVSQYDIGQEVEMIPILADPRDLYGVVNAAS